MEKKRKIGLVLGCVLVGIAVVAAVYCGTHVFIDGAVYAKDAEVLDLRGSGISVEHYEQVREKLPECKVRWDVPFQGGFYPDDTASLTVTELTDEDVALLDYLPALADVDAAECTDYPQLMELQKRHPECKVSYRVTLGGKAYGESTTELRLTDEDGAELMEMLQYLPKLKSVHFTEPAMAAEDLIGLREAYPAVDITWEKTVFGAAYADDVTELDFSGILMESEAEVEAAMEYFSALEKLILCDCGIDNETMAAYRERARENYKVVWSVKVGTLTLRTDDLTYMPEKYDQDVYDWDIHDLVYCEDMLCVDIGHKIVSNVDWIYGMPHLQYLILADTWVTDITPVGTLKELIYFELFKTDVTDYTPLLGCVSLQDANLAYTKGDASVLAEMTWLNNLWVNGCGVDQETRALLTESLPDTFIEFDNGWHMGNNWRALLNYFKMRDLLEMPYYDWGNTLGRPGDPGYPYSEETA